LKFEEQKASGGALAVCPIFRILATDGKGRQRRTFLQPTWLAKNFLPSALFVLHGLAKRVAKRFLYFKC